MGSVRIPFQAGGCYHIYNHAVGSDNIFREDENYLFFLRKFSSGIIVFADVFSYCLMLNHFHFVVRIKSKKELVNLWQDKLNGKAKQNTLNNDELLDKIMVTQFANLFNSYVQAYNKKYFRKGTLLKESFQREKVDTSDYLLKVICYVHNNPVEHGFTAKQQDWKYSSYNAILSNGNTNVSRDEVLDLFGGRENFIFMHQKLLGNEI